MITKRQFSMESSRNRCIDLRDKLLEKLESMCKNDAKILVECVSEATNSYLNGDFNLCETLMLQCLSSIEKQLNRDVEDSNQCNVESNPFQPAPKTTGFNYTKIVGMKDAKDLIQDLVILPTAFPMLVLSPPRGCLGILLFGSPGNGKSAFAEATATEINAPFFNVSMSELKSKWHGESEKRIRSLFQELRKHNLSVLFLDEVESLMCEREGTDSGITSIKTELLAEMSGMKATRANGLIVVLAATNLPATLDPAFLSRFGYKVYIRPPNAVERLDMISSFCARHGVCLSKRCQREIITATDGFSGRDIKGALDSLNYLPLQKLKAGTRSLPSDSKSSKPTDSVLLHYGNHSLNNVIEFDFRRFNPDELSVPPLTEEDVVRSFLNRSASRSPGMDFACDQFDHEYGYKSDEAYENDLHRDSCGSIFSHFCSFLLFCCCCK